MEHIWRRDILIAHPIEDFSANSVPWLQIPDLLQIFQWLQVIKTLSDATSILLAMKLLKQNSTTWVGNTFKAYASWKSFCLPYLSGKCCSWNCSLVQLFKYFSYQFGRSWNARYNEILAQSFLWKIFSLFLGPLG